MKLPFYLLADPQYLDTFLDPLHLQTWINCNQIRRGLLYLYVMLNKLLLLLFAYVLEQGVCAYEEVNLDNCKEEKD